ncbi:MAG: methyltransferase domain-containing protein [Thermoplasmata archaeon]|nr:methyltransferase domain-containing protein [Thermoplasmata archaeon]
MAESLGPAQSAGRGWVELPDREAAIELAGRLALAHRCAEAWPEASIEELEGRLVQAGESRTSAAIQWVSGSTSMRPPELVRRLGHAYVSGGGRIALGNPNRRFWLEAASPSMIQFYEEVGVAGRAAVSERRTPRLPFQRPVTLAPTWARALVNLAHVGVHDRVVDPFVGTGSLLLEAALLGARTVGIDMSATMVRGALENFTHFGQTPETLRQADAAEAAVEFPAGSFDALITDPPYGRASGTRGERPDRLWRRTLEAWAPRVRSGGRLAIVVPEGTELPSLDARQELAILQRVHRSLSREFRVYVRDGNASETQ